MQDSPRKARKLLVASLGVAAVSYVACEKSQPNQFVTGNLMAMPVDAAAPSNRPTVDPRMPVGNLAPPPHVPSRPDARASQTGNLMPPRGHDGGGPGF